MSRQAGWPACLDLDLKKKRDLSKQAVYWDLRLKRLYKGVGESSEKILSAKHTLTIPQYITRVPLGSRTSIMFNLCDKNNIKTVKTHD